MISLMEESLMEKICESCKRILQKGDKVIKLEELYFCAYSVCVATYVFRNGKAVLGEVITL
jgi:hypothetical protein